MKRTSMERILLNLLRHQEGCLLLLLLLLLRREGCLLLLRREGCLLRLRYDIRDTSHRLFLLQKYNHHYHNSMKTTRI
jgi:hypothetical protein